MYLTDWGINWVHTSTRTAGTEGQFDIEEPLGRQQGTLHTIGS